MNKPDLGHIYNYQDEAADHYQWLCVEMDEDMGYGITTDSDYRFDYPCDINVLIGRDDVIWYKPVDLIPFYELHNAEYVGLNQDDALFYSSDVGPECDMFDNQVRLFNGVPYVGALYSLLESDDYFVIMSIKNSNSEIITRDNPWEQVTTGGRCIGYRINKQFVGYIDDLPYSDFDLRERKMFTASGAIAPCFIGCLSSNGMFNLNRAFHNKESGIKVAKEDLLYENNPWRSDLE